MSLQSINLYSQLAKNKLFKKSVNFDLSRIKLALKKLGSPEKKLKNVINVIGSDGKYSVLTSLKFFIEANKEKTSAYISPSLKDIKERFWIGKRFLKHYEIKNTIKIIEKTKISLTTFEVLTLIFILNVFKRNNNYNLIEAGALFAKDSTNVFDKPLIQIVTNINKQHLNFVKKKTLNEIIKQKVGFLSNSTNIYIGKQKPSTLSSIKRILKKNKSKKIFSNSWNLLKFKNNYYYIDKKTKIKIISNNIFSRGLMDNLALAIKIALDLGINKKIIQKTIPKIFFEGRVHYLKKGKIKKKLNKNEQLLLDGAHSEVSGRNLSNYLKKIKGIKYGIWGMTKNKNPHQFIKQFKGIFKKIITIPIQDEANSLSAKTLSKIAKTNKFKAESSKNIFEALKKIKKEKKKIVIIFGSLYLIANILNKS